MNYDLWGIPNPHSQVSTAQPLDCKSFEYTGIFHPFLLSVAPQPHVHSHFDSARLVCQLSPFRIDGKVNVERCSFFGIYLPPDLQTSIPPYRCVLVMVLVLGSSPSYWTAVSGGAAKARNHSASVFVQFSLYIRFITEHGYFTGCCNSICAFFKTANKSAQLCKSEQSFKTFMRLKFKNIPARHNPFRVQFLQYTSFAVSWHCFNLSN